MAEPKCDRRLGAFALPTSRPFDYRHARVVRSLQKLDLGRYHHFQGQVEVWHGGVIQAEREQQVCLSGILSLLNAKQLELPTPVL